MDDWWIKFTTPVNLTTLCEEQLSQATTQSSDLAPQEFSWLNHYSIRPASRRS
ncbi:hypothetical protein P5673_022917 [Acropora cervicornis]|uniref:Uncharacterized protein n=1 Tax=Acropora cervicornis TaxID=6130 RepID=A0AAD9Q5S6_ACRCE|nr:hypothetical protein P5673_022917 [Acropora cervicornis]